MNIQDVIWLEAAEEKIFRKHHVRPHEVEEALTSQPHVRFIERGHRPDEDLYAAFGQTIVAVTWLYTSFVKRPIRLSS